MSKHRVNARPGLDITVRRGSSHTSDNQGRSPSNPNDRYGVAPAAATSGRAGSPYARTRAKAKRTRKGRW